MLRNYPSAQKNVFSVPFLSDELSENILWFFTGSKCNLECTHCYVESGPTANKFPFLSLETFNQRLDEALSCRYKKLELYFTGGEPFIHPDIFMMLEEALKHGNSTVLTNATLLSEKRTEQLLEIQQRVKYDLIFRVSFDGSDEESNDAIRGKNSFKRAKTGLKNLVKLGFKPIITVMRDWPKTSSDDSIRKFKRLLDEIGVPTDKQMLKILPPLRIGREAVRNRPYLEKELFSKECFNDYEYSKLQCSKCRIVSENGVWICPILINEDSARMGNTLSESSHQFPMKYMVCWTCRMEGMDCTNEELQ